MFAADIEASSASHHELLIESVVESEQVKPQLVVDGLLMHDISILSYLSRQLPSTEMNYSLFYFEKDIFRPPLFT